MLGNGRLPHPTRPTPGEFQEVTGEVWLVLSGGLGDDYGILLLLLRLFGLCTLAGKARHGGDLLYPPQRTGSLLS